MDLIIFLEILCDNNTIARTSQEFFLKITSYAVSEQSNNPFEELSDDAIKRCLKGKNPFNKKNLQLLLKAKDTVRLTKFFEEQFPEEQQNSIEDSIKEVGYDFAVDNNFGIKCADLFYKLIKEYIGSTKTHRPKRSTKVELLSSGDKIYRIIYISDALINKNENVAPYINAEKIKSLGIPTYMEYENNISLERAKVYKVSSEFYFKSQYIDGQRVLNVSTSLGKYRINGETSIKNWTSKSYANNFVSAGKYPLTAFLKILNEQNGIVQFLLLLEEMSNG